MNPFNKQYNLQGQCFQFQQYVTQNQRQLLLAINTKSEQVIIKDQPAITFEEKQLIEKLKTAQLNYIVKYVGIIEEKFKISIISEYCGQPFSEFIKSQEYTQLNKDHKMNIFKQMILAVHEFHSLGQKHYNLTLDSFVINKETLLVKLNDFGLQKISNIDKSQLGLDYFQYSAPETRTKNYFDQTDSWSLGCILYVLLTGTLLFSNFSEYSSTNQFQIDRKLQSQQHLSNIEKEMLKKLLKFLPYQRIKIPQFILTYFPEDQSNQIEIEDCKFQLINFIGYGNSGMVYQAKNLNNNEIVAIKQYWNINETKLKGLRHLKQSSISNVVEIKKIKTLTQLQVFVVLEFVQENLQNYIYTQQYQQSSKEQKNLIFQQMIQAIKQFQNIFLVHGKLNFESFAVFHQQNEIKVKLMNFGFSYYNISQTLDLNQYFYKAPEQLQLNTQQFINHSDQWALGCLWFELLTEIRFFEGNTIDQIKKNIIFSNQQQIEGKINDQMLLNETEKKLIKQLIHKSPGSQRIKIQDLISYIIPQTNENLIVINDEIYDKLQQIGSGMQGQVYMGISRKTTQKVAIKVQKETSEVELKLLQKLEKTKTKNLLEIYGIQENRGKLTVVMELGPQDLNSYMKTKEFQQLSNNEKNLIFLQMVQSVEDLHSLGFIHSDAKPENFIIGNTQNGETYVKLIDFGVCLEIKNNQKQLYQGSSQIMAPECLENKFDTSTDVWALGCVWFEMLTGEYFFKSTKKIKKSTQDQINDRINQQFNLTEFEKKMLKKFLLIDPAQRMKLVEFLNILLQQSSSKLQKVLEIKTDEQQKQIQKEKQIQDKLQNQFQAELECRIYYKNKSQLILQKEKYDVRYQSNMQKSNKKNIIQQVDQIEQIQKPIQKESEIQDKFQNQIDVEYQCKTNDQNNSELKLSEDEIIDIEQQSITQQNNDNQEYNIIQQENIQQNTTDKEGEQQIDEELQKEIELKKQQEEIQIQKEIEISIQQENQRKYIEQLLLQQEEEKKQKKLQFQEAHQRIDDLMKKLEKHFKDSLQNLIQSFDKIQSIQIDNHYKTDSFNMIKSEQHKLVTQQQLIQNKAQELEQIIQSENLLQLNQLENNLQDFYEQMQMQEELILENIDEKIRELEKIYDEKVQSQLKQSKDQFELIYNKVYKRYKTIQEKHMKVTQNYQQSKLQIQNDLEEINLTIQQSFQQLEIFTREFNDQQQANSSSSIELLINQLQDFHKSNEKLIDKLQFLENQLKFQEEELEILAQKNKLFQEEYKQLSAQLESYQNDRFICEKMKQNINILFSQFSDLLDQNSQLLQQESNIILQEVQDFTQKLEQKQQEMKVCNKTLLEMREKCEIDSLKEVEQNILQTIQNNKQDWLKKFQNWFDKNDWVVKMDQSFTKDLDDMKNEQTQFLLDFDQDLQQIENSQQIISISVLKDKISKYQYLLEMYDEKFDKEIDLKQSMLRKKIKFQQFNLGIRKLQIKFDNYFQKDDLERRIQYEQKLDDFDKYFQKCQDHFQHDQQLFLENKSQLLKTESNLESEKKSLSQKFDEMLKQEQIQFDKLKKFHQQITSKFEAMNFSVNKVELSQLKKISKEHELAIKKIESQTNEEFDQCCDKNSIIYFAFDIDARLQKVFQANNYINGCIDQYKKDEPTLVKLGYLAKAIGLFEIINQFQKIKKLQQKQKNLSQSIFTSIINEFPLYESQFNQLMNDIEKDQYQINIQTQMKLQQDEQYYKNLQTKCQNWVKVRLKTKVHNQSQVKQILDLYQFIEYNRIKIHIILLSSYKNQQQNIE